MNYTIKPLTEETSHIFIDYLGNLDFSHAPHWSTCFCRYYHSTCSLDEWMKRTGTQNQNEALQEISSGTMKGYLIFDQETCIGWCNANDVRNYARLQNEVAHLLEDKKIGCVICYVIHPKYRGQGVARALLKQAIIDFRTNGFNAVVAFPFKSGSSQTMYRGTYHMYEEQGFVEIKGNENQTTMWLDL